MKTLKPRIPLLVAVLLMFVATWGYAQLPATPDHGAIMERKLVGAQRVLEGIARADFVEIEKQAQLLRLLSQEAGWNVVQTQSYVRLSEDFRSTAEQLKAAAGEKNLDAVGLAYVKLSISCIDCHRHAKEELSRIGRQDTPSKVNSTLK